MNKSVLSLFLLFTVFGYSQDISSQLPNISTPSPEAYSLGAYGNLPVGAFTGAINKQLPISFFKTSNIEVPVYLSYSNNGLKVDDSESIVGLGWNLNVGGIITRVVRDEPDENASTYGPSIVIPKEMLNQISAKSPEAQEYFYIKQQGEGDSEDDIFYINVNGISGKFHIKNNNEIQLVDNHDIKIEFNNSLTYNFIITDSNGIKYFFEESQKSISRTSGSGLHDPPKDYYSAWYLTKIVHYKGDEVYFSYVQKNKTLITGQSQNVTKSYPHQQFFLGGNSFTQNPTISPVYSHHLTSTNKYVSQITSNANRNGSLVFSYDGDFLNKIEKKDNQQNIIERIIFNTQTTANNRTFLKGIDYLDPLKKYVFNYINEESFPSRLSYDKDHWGYYNGQNNSNLIPSGLRGYSISDYSYNGSNKEPFEDFAKIGMLNYIYYPTKGFTKIDYESNDTSVTEVVAPINTGVGLSLNTGKDDFGTFTDSAIIEPPIGQEIIFYGSSSFNSSCSSQFDLGFRHKSRVRMYCIEDEVYVNFVSLDGLSIVGSSPQLPAGVSVSFKANVIAGKTYRVELSTSRNCTRAGLSFNYAGEATTVTHNVITGGVRVKKTSDYTSLDDLSPVIKRYFYSPFDNLERSSGNKGADPFFFSKGYVKLGLDFGKTVSVASSSLVNLYDTGNSNVFYKFVSISYGGDNFENGGEEIEFNVDRDYYGQTINYSLPLVTGLDENRAATWTNFGFKNGLELKRKIFDKNFQIKQEKETIYETIPLTESPQYNFRNELGYTDTAGLGGHNFYNCSESSTSYVFNSFTCSTNHTHASVSQNSFYCIALNANNIAVPGIDHSCYQLPVNTSLTHNFDNQNITVTKYKNLSYRIFPKKVIEKNYFINGSITNTSITEVRNEYPYFVSLTSFINSKNGTTEKKFYYPLDYANDPVMSVLVNQNRISEPVKIESISKSADDIILSKSTARINYELSNNNLMLPKSNQFQKNNITNGPEAIEDRIIFQRYDDFGNPLEISKSDDVHIVYIWGYDNTYPIAKIENATYAALENLPSFGLNFEITENLSAIQEQELRSLTNTMVTTYTYAPLIGVTSMTDPRGDTIYYEYDEFNRLKQVKDKDGNILNKNDYNYANQN